MGSGLVRGLLPPSARKGRALRARHNKSCYGLNWCFSARSKGASSPQWIRQRWEALKMHWATSRRVPFLGCSRKFTLVCCVTPHLCPVHKRSSEEIYSYSKQYTTGIMSGGLLQNRPSAKAMQKMKGKRSSSCSNSLLPVFIDVKAQQVRLEIAPSAVHFWAAEVYIETGVSMRLEKLWNLISLNLSLVLLEDDSWVRFIPPGKLWFLKKQKLFVFLTCTQLTIARGLLFWLALGIWPHGSCLH